MKVKNKGEVAIPTNDLLKENVICRSLHPAPVEYFISYQYLSRRKNESYDASKVAIPYRSKLALSNSVVDASRFGLVYMHNNVDKMGTPKRRSNIRHVVVQHPVMMSTQPRYFTTLMKYTHDMNTGEIIASEIVETNDTKARLNRRFRALKAFTNHFEPLYRQKKVTALFMTFTIANENAVKLRTVIDQFKKRCKRNGYPCRGYFWVLEISESLHVHYHAVFYIDRMNITGKKMPEWWKLDELWGARTNVVIVRRSVTGYLSKYLSKGYEKIEGSRMYGKSMPKETKK